MLKALKAETVPDCRLVNKAGLCEFFAIELPTASAWVRRGCPFVQRGERGQAWQFDLLAVAAWRLGGETESDDDPEKMPPKERLDWFRGSQIRDDWSVKTGTLIPEEDVAAAWTEMIMAVKSRLFGLPARLSGELAKMTDRKAIQLALRDAIYDVCESLADPSDNGEAT